MMAGKFTEKLANEILKRLAEGESLNSIADDSHTPARSVMIDWAMGFHKGAKAFDFPAKYARARKIGYLGLADEINDIADDGRNDWMEKFNKDGEAVGWKVNGEAVQRSKLRVDTRKWMLSKVLPKIYGDRLEIDAKSSDGSMSPKSTIDMGELSNSAMEEILKARDKSNKS